MVEVGVEMTNSGGKVDVAAMELTGVTSNWITNCEGVKYWLIWQ
jgi:hypothetical protein